MNLTGSWKFKIPAGSRYAQCHGCVRRREDARRARLNRPKY